MSEISINSFVTEVLERVDREIGPEEVIGFPEGPVKAHVWYSSRKALAKLLSERGVRWDSREEVDTHENELFKQVCRAVIGVLDTLISKAPNHSPRKDKLALVKAATIHKVELLTGLRLSV